MQSYSKQKEGQPNEKSIYVTAEKFNSDKIQTSGVKDSDSSLLDAMSFSLAIFVKPAIRARKKDSKRETGYLWSEYKHHYATYSELP